MATRSKTTSRPAAPGAPITFALQGVLDAPAATRGAGVAAPLPPAELPGGLARGTLQHSVRVQTQRAGGGGTVRVQAEPGRDVVVLRLSGGPALVLHPETARALMLAQQGTRPTSRGLPGSAGDDAVIEVPTQLRWRGLEAAAAAGAATRGGMLASLGEALLSGFDIVRGAAGDALAGVAAAKLAERIDDQVVPGLYPLPRQGRLTKFKGSGVAPLAALPASAKPLLVFVHGTFSNSAAAFGDLWSQHPQRVAALFEHYDGHVFALDHATLTVSPVANALALAHALPQGAQLHLVTHSRGGLVAEVLARVAGNPTLAGEDLAAFADHDRKALKQLGAELKARAVRVARVVRVACPARGTLLASGRLDAYLSVFRWTLQLAGVPVLPELVDLLSAVAERREDVHTMPGLAAQIPDSALIRWLHAGEEPVPGELRVVAGDVQPDSPTAWLKTLLADGFYWTDNDFVVQTSSMYGGAPRAGGASFLLDRGGKVSHGRYFHHPRSAEGVCNALLHDAPEGFQPIGPLSWQGQDSSGVRGRARGSMRGRPLERARLRGGDQDTRAASDKPAVILLPGILGSNIAVDGKRIWLGLRMVGGLKRLAYPDGQRVVKPDGPISLIYDDLAEHLAATHEVIEFAFDWRRPIEEEAQRLANVAAAALADRQASGQPVRFVAHSMGGVVVRAMQIVAPDTWKTLMAREGARVLMLGTPNSGSWAPMQVLSGDDTFGNTLVAFGAPFGDHEARQMMAQFPGFLQLQAALVDDPRGLDREATWRKLADDDLAAVREHNWWHSEGLQLNAYKWGVPSQAVLDRAVELRRKLDAQRDRELPGFADKLLLVVGKARFTPDGYEIGPQGLEYLDAQDDGDGRVTRPSARLPGVRTWELDCEHGSLPDEEDAFAAYTELLEAGSTARLKALPDTAPPQRGARAAASTSTAVHVRSRPSRQPKALQPPAFEAEVARRAFDEAAPITPRSTLPALAVEVLNANLMFTRVPLLVGHYASTRLTGAEWVVDDLLDGALRTALKAGIYPDRAGEHRVFRNASKGDNPLQLPRPEWAIVVGLGAESELKGSALLDSVRAGLLGWAQALAERPGGAPPSFDLAATLVGSGGTGITPGQSAQMIARAAHEANQTLAECGWPLVASLTLVELYLDRASEAWRALQVQASAAPERWRIGEQVRRGAGALRRTLDASYRGADYDLISAVVHGSGIGAQIAYTLDTRRARSEVRAQKTQPRLLREMVRRNSNAQQQDPRIGHTLYQLLVPVEMDAFFGGTTEMRLELDRGTAGIPWELLRHPSDDESADGPWAVRTKLLRKLRTTDFRPQVRDAGNDAGVLVIGEPATPPPPKDKPEQRYARLPGARREALTVQESLAERLPGGPDAVRGLIAGDDPATQPDAHRIVGELLARDWRVVHIAGHGEAPKLVGPEPQQEGDPPQRVADPGGVVLSHGFLGPSEIRSMRTVPELVFVNCCHLAERDAAQLLSDDLGSRAEFASTVADELIKIGVRCVVAAGWAVEDGPACEFAHEFYRALLDGERFLDASARARAAAWKVRGSGNTWAAYQCYGDPDWRLVTRGAATRGNTLRERYAGISSAVALELALETVAVEARHIRSGTGSDESEARRRRAERDRDAQLQRLIWLESHFAERWGHLGLVADHFGQAWKALGDEAKAIEWFERAIAAEDGGASHKAAEQLANLRVRQAESGVSKAAAALREARGRAQARGAKGAADKKVLAEAQAALARAADKGRRAVVAALAAFDNLTEQHPTIERHNLAGSAWKRLAMIESDLGREAETRKAIEHMGAHYARAAEAARKTGSDALFYPGLNLIVADIAAHAGQARWAGLDATLVAEVQASLEAKGRRDPDFWSVVGRTELQLLQAAAAGGVAGAQPRVAAEFADLQRRVSAPTEWRSVYDTERFVLERYARHAGAAEQRACRELLAQLAGYGWP
jgi:tetratricopeptide (TPR) repeat protein